MSQDGFQLQAPRFSKQVYVFCTYIVNSGERRKFFLPSQDLTGLTNPCVFNLSLAGSWWHFQLETQLHRVLTTGSLGYYRVILNLRVRGFQEQISPFLSFFHSFTHVCIHSITHTSSVHLSIHPSIRLSILPSIWHPAIITVLFMSCRAWMQHIKEENREREEKMSVRDPNLFHDGTQKKSQL